MTLIFLNAVVKSANWYLFFDTDMKKIYRSTCDKPSSSADSGCNVSRLSMSISDITNMKKDNAVEVYVYETLDGYNGGLKPKKDSIITTKWGGYSLFVDPESHTCVTVAIGNRKPSSVKVNTSDATKTIVFVKFDWDRII